MLETDAPYMTPAPNRGKRNDSTYLKYVAEKIAQIKNLSIDRVIEMTSSNARNLFKLTLMFVLLCSTQVLNAQKKDSWGDDRDNPYSKNYGFGFFAGSNVIVNTETRSLRISENDTTMDVSGKTAVAYGASFLYSPSDYVMFSLSYLYSKEKLFYSDSSGTDYQKYQSIEISAHLIANPYSRVNFYGIIGYSYFHNQYYTENILGAYTKSNKNAINTGLGFIVNIPTKYGLITPMAEWKLSFLLGSTKLYDKQYVEKTSPYKNNEVKISTFFSIPRLSIVWYPKF